MSSKKASYPVCRYLDQPGGCRYGAACKFSHDRKSTSQHLGRRESSPWQPQDDFQIWLYKIPRTATARPLGNGLSSFFKQGYVLMCKDVGTMQAVVTRLVSEGGLLRIDELCQNIVLSENRPGHVQRSCFEDMLLPLLQILSKREVMSSLLLENTVNTIANFLFGPVGRRPATLFSFAARALSELADAQATLDSTILASALEACLAVLWKVVDLNGSAPLMEEFYPITEALNGCIAAAKDPGEDFAIIRARGFLGRVQRRLGEASELPEAKSERRSVLARPTFSLTRDAPGFLSEQ